MLNRIDLRKQRAAMRRRIRVVLTQRRLTTAQAEPPSDPALEPRD